MFPRKQFLSILSWVPRDEYLVLVGPRQAGKSTLLRMIQASLDDQSERTIFINLEDYEMRNLFDTSPKNLLSYLRQNGYDASKQKVYVFIDEIQYLSDPTNFLKYLYDEHYKELKLIVSGSSSFYIDRTFKDSLAGRKKVFSIDVLDFEEFLSFKGRDDIHPSQYSALLPSQRQEIEFLFDEYFRFGGYPKVVAEEQEIIKKELLAELVNSYLRKDIQEANIRDEGRFLRLYRLLYSGVGNLLNKHELSNTLDCSMTMIENYLYILEKTFHLQLLSPYQSNIRKELTKMPKLYMLDTGIKNYLEKNFAPLGDRVDKGAIFENMVYKKLSARYRDGGLYFWRTTDKKEIDFIVDSEQKMAIESKYAYNGKGIPHLDYFVSENPSFEKSIISLSGEKGATNYFSL